MKENKIESCQKCLLVKRYQRQKKKKDLSADLIKQRLQIYLDHVLFRDLFFMRSIKLTVISTIQR